MYLSYKQPKICQDKDVFVSYILPANVAIVTVACLLASMDQRLQVRHIHNDKNMKMSIS